MRLYFRNTVKNKKIMWLYLILSLLFILISVMSLLCSLAFDLKGLFITLSLLFFALFVFLFFLICLTNNGYKFKYYFLSKKDKEKIKKYCEDMNYDKHDFKIFKTQMIDNYRQFGRVYPKYALLELFKYQMKNFDYKKSDDTEKFKYIVFCLYNCFIREDNFYIEIGKHLINLGFSKQEIKILFNKEYIIKDLKLLVQKIINNDRYEFIDIYKNEYSIKYLTYFLSGEINFEEYKEGVNPKYVYSALKHNRFYPLKNDIGSFNIILESFSLDSWNLCRENHFYATEDIAIKDYKIQFANYRQSELNNYVWFLFVVKKLPQNYIDLMDYYSGVQGEGHFIYFDNHQSELTRISKSLKSLLPKNLYDNFLQAKKGFRENPKTYDVSLNADNFFTSNIKIIEDIIFSYSKSIII